MTKETHYLGKICPTHPEEQGLRYKCNGSCILCNQAAAIQWRAENPAEVAKRSAKYYKENKKGIALRVKMWRQAQAMKRKLEKERGQENLDRHGFTESQAGSSEKTEAGRDS